MQIERNPIAAVLTPAVRKWNSSVRFRLLLFGLMPVFLVFPLVIGVLLIAGGQRADALIATQVRSNLAGVRNYLDVIKSDTLLRVTDLSRSEHFATLLSSGASRVTLDQALATAARGSGLDYLVVAAADGTVLGSSTGVAVSSKLPDSHVIRQAQLGLATVSIERFDPRGLQSFSPRFPAQARVRPEQDAGAQASGDPALESRGLLVNAAAHFPLAIRTNDAILVGGVILNNNLALIGHMREVIYPVGSLPEGIEGMTAIYVDSTGVAVSRQRHAPEMRAGLMAPPAALEGTAGAGGIWLGVQMVGGVPYLTGFAPILNGDGQRIGMVAAGFPEAPYHRMTWTVLAMIAGLMGISLALISMVFLRVGKSLTTVLNNVSSVMTRFLDGDRNARFGASKRNDEITLLTQRLDTLLETISRQEVEQRQAQKAISDEASRWRALFVQERDGVVILDERGRVLEANPQFDRMLGYPADEAQRLQIGDWDERFAPGEFDQLVRQLGPDGMVFQTTHRRRDGTTYVAEVSLSRATWAGKTFVMMSARDISSRVEADRQLRLAANVFSHASEAIVIADPDRRMLDVNAAYTRLTGYTREEVLGTRLPLPGTESRNPGLVEQLLKVLERDGAWSGEITTVRKNGETYPVRLDVSTVRDDGGKLLHILAMFSDITIELENRRRLELFALYDPLTQLPNRRLLAERFAQAQAGSARGSNYGALMMIDLDNFKSLNDAHGHAAGDLLLIEVARRISACLREVDTVARLGGDEFVILLTGLSPNGWVAQSDARAFAEKIRMSLVQPYVLHDVPGACDGTVLEHRCSASIGISLFWGKEETLDEVQARADEAMFLAKARGRNGVSFRDGDKWPDRSVTCE